MLRNQVPVKSLEFMLPLQNIMRGMSFDASDINKNDENVRDVVKLIQKLGTGQQTVESVMDLANKANEYLFGKKEKPEFSSFYRGGSRGKRADTNTITAALYLHDRYNEAVEEADRVEAFVRKKWNSKL